jgi:hypothetical protein
MPQKLYDAYSEVLLQLPPDDKLLAAVVIPGRTRDYIAIGTGEQPALLLSYSFSASLQRPPIRLQHLTIEFGIRCRVRAGAKVKEGYFVVISLRNPGTDLTELFCIAAEALISSLPPAPTLAEIERVVRQFVELMTALSLPSSRAIAGLWAELWLISVAENPEAAAIAWHETSTDRFDFAFPEHLVEVKATEREERNHEFSYDQISGVGVPINIASLRIRRIRNGKSIPDLIDTLSAVLSAAMREKVVRNVFNAIGSGLSDASEIRFDEAFARQNLRSISAVRIPVPEIPDGSPISAVRFRVNLSDASLAPYLVQPVASAALARRD